MEKKIIKRKRFNKNQILILENAFNSNKYPRAEEKNKLAERINTDYKKVQVWFQNQRAKKKKSDPGQDHSSTSTSTSTSASISTLALTNTITISDFIQSQLKLQHPLYNFYTTQSSSPSSLSNFSKDIYPNYTPGYVFASNQLSSPLSEQHHSYTNILSHEQYDDFLPSEGEQEKEEE